MGLFFTGRLTRDPASPEVAVRGEVEQVRGRSLILQRGWFTAPVGGPFSVGVHCSRLYWL
jgi:hypothetical protein